MAYEISKRRKANNAWIPIQVIDFTDLPPAGYLS